MGYVLLRGEGGVLGGGGWVMHWSGVVGHMVMY